jgi:hypothetical protein
VVLALLCTVSVMSGVFDGSYSADLAAADRLLQLSLVAATAALGAAAVGTAVR